MAATNRNGQRHVQFGATAGPWWLSTVAAHKCHNLISLIFVQSKFQLAFIWLLLEFTLNGRFKPKWPTFFFFKWFRGGRVGDLYDNRTSISTRMHMLAKTYVYGPVERPQRWFTHRKNHNNTHHNSMNKCVDVKRKRIFMNKYFRRFKIFPTSCSIIVFCENKASYGLASLRWMSSVIKVNDTTVIIKSKVFWDNPPYPP